jgi:hypothetical protein
MFNNRIKSSNPLTKNVNIIYINYLKMKNSITSFSRKNKINLMAFLHLIQFQTSVAKNKPRWLQKSWKTMIVCYKTNQEKEDNFQLIH